MGMTWHKWNVKKGNHESYKPKLTRNHLSKHEEHEKRYLSKRKARRGYLSKIHTINCNTSPAT